MTQTITPTHFDPIYNVTKKLKDDNTEIFRELNKFY